MNAKNQIIARKSKRKMREAANSQQGNGAEEHFFHTHKVPTEPVDFFHAGEADRAEAADEAKPQQAWGEMATEAVDIGKAILDQGRTYVKEHAPELKASGMKLLKKGKKLLKGKPARKAAAPRKVASAKRAAPKRVAVTRKAAPKRAAAGKRVSLKANSKVKTKKSVPRGAKAASARNSRSAIRH